MEITEHHWQLYETFCEFYPPWKEHIEYWQPTEDNTISVKMKTDGYVTSGFTYIFGDEGCGKWHLERMAKETSQNNQSA